METPQPHMVLRVTTASIVLSASIAVVAQQIADPAFVATVARPAFARAAGPAVVIDEAHANFHTAGGRYEPFARLLTNDGYRIEPGRFRFATDALRGNRILVVANAMVAADQSPDASAFTDDECEAVADWVRAGGSFLLIADHAPAGAAAAKLAKKFGVDMGLGYVFDATNFEPPNTSTLIFSDTNGLLGDHWVLRGRDPSEVIRRVLTFAGQSLTVPAGGTALLKLSRAAVEPRTSEHLAAVAQAIRSGGKPSTAIPAAGPAQAIAMTFGSGRIAMFGEAALFSAQLLREGDRESRAGMNVPGADNRQLALNVIHWLSRLDE